MGAKSCVVVQHVAFEDLGTFEQPIRDAGYAIEYLQAGVDDIGLAADADLAVILGGPIGVYESEAYPFLPTEIETIAYRLSSRRCTLGICLGAQLIAAAAGARVYPGTAGKEIGWGPITLTPSGREGALRHLESDDGIVVHWHGDTFDLPEGAVLLASSARYRNQAFAIGDHVLALQFHPEVEWNRFERWLIGHTIEISSTGGISPQSLRADARRYGEGLSIRGRRLIEEWISATT